MGQRAEDARVRGGERATHAETQPGLAHTSVEARFAAGGELAEERVGAVGAERVHKRGCADVGIR
jgi:hypothetical protein